MTRTMSLWRHRFHPTSLTLIVSGLHLSSFTMANLCAVLKDDISREQLKALLYEEIMTFNPQPFT